MDERLIRSIRTSMRDADFAEQLSRAIAAAAGGAFELKEFEGAWSDVLNRARGGTPQIAGHADGDVALVSVKDLAVLLKAIHAPTMSTVLQDAGFNPSHREWLRVSERRVREALSRRDIRAAQDGGRAMAEAGQTRMSQDEFVEFARAHGERWELVDGKPMSKPDFDQRHQRILANILFSFYNQADLIKNHTIAARILVPTNPGTIRCPDIVLYLGRRCGRTTVVAEPRLIIDVLSPSTPDFDSHRKVDEYRNLLSVKYILLIDADGVGALLHTRAGEAWCDGIYSTLDDVVELPGIGTRLQLEDIYEGVEFS